MCTDEANACNTASTQNDVNGGNHLSTRGYQIILFSAVVLVVLERTLNPLNCKTVTYGGSTGLEIAIPVLRR